MAGADRGRRLPQHGGGRPEPRPLAGGGGGELHAGDRTCAPEYVYAFVDPDATLGAYPTDDFFWTTGWQGHKADLGFGIGSHVALHAVGQLQRLWAQPRASRRTTGCAGFRLEIRLKS